MLLAYKLRDATKEIHKEVEQLKFLKRYKTKDLTLEDHYFHLKEIYAIYLQFVVSLLKLNINEKNCTNQLFYIQELINTNFEIEKDLNILEQIIPDRLSKNLTSLENCPATKVYANHIASLKNPEEILAHCCVHWFGDSYGGQKLKKKVIDLYVIYKQDKQDNQNDIDPPVNFYNSAISSQILTKNLNNLGQNKNFTQDKEVSFLKEAQEAFSYHKLIFKQLEKKRQKHIKAKKNYNYFNTIATITGVVAVGVAISYGYYRNIQPK